MKTKLTLLVLCLAASVSLKAQMSNAILFAENGEKFQVMLNGVVQNATPQPNVKLTGLNAPGYKAKIIFENKDVPPVDFNLFFPTQGNEVTWNIKKNGKGNYVVRFVSEVAVAQAPPAPATETVVAYSATPPAETTTTTIQQTTTTTNGAAPNGNVSINMSGNPNGQGGGINMNVSGMDPNMSGTSTTTTTTTTTSSSSGFDNASAAQPARVSYVDGYNGAVGCPAPMSRSDFQSFKSSVTSKTFEDSKLTIAKQVLNNNCLTSGQVREIMGLFTYENTKLDFAKYAYGHTYDIGNYFKVNDTFQFEASITELNNYISQQHH
jgi:hypothetical protein